MDDAHDLGVVLKKLREDAGLSQRELADQLGVQQPAVARWEAGRVRMRITRIDEILRHFGYAAEYDLTAVPIGEAVRNGVPLTMVRHRP
jgi:transcriptional regulator with XRE-family HTH domain